MWGGSGPDTFRFDDKDAGDATAGPLSDVIFDFSAEDTLDLLAVDVLGFAGDGDQDPGAGHVQHLADGRQHVCHLEPFGSLHDVELRGFTGDPYSQIRWYEDDFLATPAPRARSPWERPSLAPSKWIRTPTGSR